MPKQHAHTSILDDEKEKLETVYKLKPELIALKESIENILSKYNPEQEQDRDRLVAKALNAGGKVKEYKNTLTVILGSESLNSDKNPMVFYGLLKI